MDQIGKTAIQELVQALNRQALTDQEYEAKKRQRYFDQVNYQGTKAVLEELRIPPELQNHIPREPAQFGRLNEQSRKTRRNNFKVPKCFPAATTFRTGNRNKNLDKALKNLATHFQSNVKYNLGGTIETTSKLTSTGILLRRRIREHEQLVKLIQAKKEQGLDFNSQSGYLINRLKAEFGLYKQVLVQLQEIFDRLQDLIFLQSDAAADGIEQITSICLALRNLKPRKDYIRPTKEDYKDAQGSGYGYVRRTFYGRGRGFGRGRGRGSSGGYRNGNLGYRYNSYNGRPRYGNPGYNGNSSGQSNNFGNRNYGQQRQ